MTNIQNKLINYQKILWISLFLLTLSTSSINFQNNVDPDEQPLIDNLNTRKNPNLFKNSDVASVSQSYNEFSSYGDLISLLDTSTADPSSGDFTPNGTIFAWGDTAGKVKFIDLANLERQIAPLDHGSDSQTVDSLDFSPNGALLATGGGGGNQDIKVWDVSNNLQNIKTFSKFKATVLDLAFSPNSRFLASVHTDDTIYLWDVKCLCEADDKSFSKSPQSIAFNNDGSLLAVGFNDGSLELLSINELSKLESLVSLEDTNINPHVGSINSVMFSRDGTTLASGGEDGDVILWNTSSNTILRKISGSNVIWSLDFSTEKNETQLLATGDTEGNVNLINLTSKFNPSEITAHSGFDRDINFVKFSPDGTMLVTGAENGELKLWNTAHTESVDTLTGHTDQVVSMLFPEDDLLISGGWNNDKSLKLWNITSKKEFNSITFANSIISIASFQENQSNMILAIVSGFNISIMKLNLDNWSLENLTELTIGSGKILSVQFLSTGFLVSVEVAVQNPIKLWDINLLQSDPIAMCCSDLNVEDLFIGVYSNILDISKTDIISIIGSDSKIYFLNISSNQIISSFDPGSPPTTSAILFSQNEPLLAFGSSFFPERHLQLLDTSDIANPAWNVNYLGDHPSSQTITTLDFSPDGTILASGSGELDMGIGIRIVKLWDVSTTSELRQITLPSDILSLKFSPDGRVLAASSWDKTITLWKDLDNDSDGMPDWWERKFNLNQANFVDKFGDPDQDGLINSLEYFLGSNPFNNDSDSDGILDGVEYHIGLNPALKDLDKDYDNDGMPNGWEAQMGLNPIDSRDAAEDADNDLLDNLWEFQHGFDATKFGDVFGDDDDDGINNYLEIYWGLNPNDPADALLDKDEDGMPNWWEAQMGLNLNISDELDDRDNDLMTNLYEYQMDLDADDPLDANDDLDRDGLLNWQEANWPGGFQSWANQSDTDGDLMSDYYEWNMTFNPENISDGLDDADMDGILNFREALAGLDARDPTDADLDYDSDWVNNRDEANAGTNPYDIFSVPLFSFSVVHLIGGIFSLITVLFLYRVQVYRHRRQDNLVSVLGAPDFITATQVKKSGYSSYKNFVEASKEAERLVNRGTLLMQNSDFNRALQQYDQALGTYERLQDQTAVAEVVMLAARVHDLNKSLQQETSVLLRFPKDISMNAKINGYNYIIQALISESEQSWGTAEVAWKNSLSITSLPLQYQLLSRGALVNSQFRSWFNNPSEENFEETMSQLNSWIQHAEAQNHAESLCQAYLLQAQITLIRLDVDHVEEWLVKCLNIAKLNELQLYLDRAQSELTRFREKIDKRKNPEEQEREIQSYIKEAFEYLQSEEDQKQKHNYEKDE